MIKETKDKEPVRRDNGMLDERRAEHMGGRMRNQTFFLIYNIYK